MIRFLFSSQGNLVILFIYFYFICLILFFFILLLFITFNVFTTYILWFMCKQIAIRLGVPCGKVQNVIIWGNHSSTQFPDVTHATAEINGKQVPVYDAVKDDNYLKNEFVSVCYKHGRKMDSPIYFGKFFTKICLFSLLYSSSVGFSRKSYLHIYMFLVFAEKF